MGSSLLITRLLPIGGCLSLPYAPRKGRLEVSLPHSARHAQPSVSRLRICARSRDTTDPETHRLTLKQQFLASLNVSDLSYQVVGWSYFAYCVASAFVSLAIFQQLQEAIADTAIATGYKGPVQDLQLLDLRDGYLPSMVHTTMQAWGQQGRCIYYLVEFVDVTCYHVGYRGAFLLMFNRVGDKLVQHKLLSPFLRRLAALPIVLSAIDLSEDCAQIAVVTTYNDSWQLYPQYWGYLVMLASTINQVKWACVRMGFTLFMLGILLLVVSLLIGARNNDHQPDSHV